jgi:hypothetical protein
LVQSEKDRPAREAEAERQAITRKEKSERWQRQLTYLTGKRSQLIGELKALVADEKSDKIYESKRITALGNELAMINQLINVAEPNI